MTFGAGAGEAAETADFADGVDTADLADCVLLADCVETAETVVCAERAEAVEFESCTELFWSWTAGVTWSLFESATARPVPAKIERAPSVPVAIHSLRDIFSYFLLPLVTGPEIPWDFLDAYIQASRYEAKRSFR